MADENPLPRPLCSTVSDLLLVLRNGDGNVLISPGVSLAVAKEMSGHLKEFKVRPLNNLILTLKLAQSELEELQDDVAFLQHLPPEFAEDFTKLQQERLAEIRSLIPELSLRAEEEIAVLSASPGNHLQTQLGVHEEDQEFEEAVVWADFKLEVSGASDDSEIAPLQADLDSELNMLAVQVDDVLEAGSKLLEQLEAERDRAIADFVIAMVLDDLETHALEWEQSKKSAWTKFLKWSLKDT